MADAGDNDIEWEAENEEIIRVEDPNDEDESHIPRNADGSFDGGVAVGPDSNKVTALECDLMLFLESTEIIEGHEKHPVLTPGATVCIGMDKSTKLVSIFKRYVEFVNEHSLDDSSLLRLDNFEFVHCTILHNSDTAEVAALMKNDKIRVQKIRKNERAYEAKSKMLQREADRNYFEQFRNLTTDLSGSCDVIFDCQGKLVDGDGLNQEVLRTTLRGHSAIICKRSKWLKDLIKQAREELERKSVITLPDVENMKESPKEATNRGHESDDGYDGIEALPYPAQVRNAQGFQEAAQIEIDDDDDEASNSLIEASRHSPIFSSSSGSNMLWVTIPNHPPEAVRLLLEYCMTNSVLSLGCEAFWGAWKSPNDDTETSIHSSCLPRRWPESRKHPMVTFAAALAGISLAEEAKLPRLSLMCEVAASQLVQCANVVEALSMCSRQEITTGNPLKRLRTAAMRYVLKGKRLDHLVRAPSFSRAINDPLRSAAFVPSLFQGLGDVVAAGKEPNEVTRGKLHMLALRTQDSFKDADIEDAFNREMERRKYRKEPHENSASMSDEEISSNKHASMDWDFSSHSNRRGLKRSAHSSFNKSSAHAKHIRYKRSQRKSSKGDKLIMKKYR
mmetsp:Transcript_19292/g.29387  ORF Transcript_19292/g.29387 Transcript_19292/m.29387 type:complete len:618 (-) Transcript_19292:559-2412(-)